LNSSEDKFIITSVKTIEIFAKYSSFSTVAKKRGHLTFAIDNSFYPDIDYVTEIEDINLDRIPFKPDFIWARPPGTNFSVASMGTHWNSDNTPKTINARIAISQIKDLMKIIKTLEPKYWLIENPRGKLRKLGLIDNKYLNTVTLCQYGHQNMKATDLWANFYEIWNPRPMCKNGDSCHISAPRGSRTGSQGDLPQSEKWDIPSELSNEILEAIEQNMG